MCVIASLLSVFFEALNSEHHSNKWRLFSDSSKASLKAVWLYITLKKIGLYVKRLFQKGLAIITFHYSIAFKLGLFKNFDKAIDQDDRGFRYLQTKVSAKSKAKLKAAIFKRLKIQKLMNDKLFEEYLNLLKKEAWNQFGLVVRNFLGNCKSSL